MKKEIERKEYEFYCDTCGDRISYGMNLCVQHKKYPSRWWNQGIRNSELVYQREIGPYRTEEKLVPLPDLNP